MNDAHDNLKAATRLLDPRFNYIPAAETNIAATWRRFGFNPHVNQQRRERLRNSREAQEPAVLNPGEDTSLVRGRLQFY